LVTWLWIQKRRFSSLTSIACRQKSGGDSLKHGA